MRVLITRPEPDAAREAETLAERGHEPVLAPLLEIEFLPGVSLGLDGAQALIVTSRNALRALAAHAELEQALRHPLFAVGEATAREARGLGFVEVIIGPGTAATLAALIQESVEPIGGALVHLAGETVAFDLKSALEGDGFEVRQTVLYRATPVSEFPATVAAELQAGKVDAVILLSPRTARTFADLVGRHGMVTQGKSLICYCMSPAVAEAVSALGFEVRMAARPREEDVLALLDSEAASS